VLHRQEPQQGGAQCELQGLPGVNCGVKLGMKSVVLSGRVPGLVRSVLLRAADKALQDERLNELGASLQLNSVDVCTSFQQDGAAGSLHI
jgi:hypothetical protein